MSFTVLQLTPEEGESCCYGALDIKIVATDKVLQGKNVMFVLTNIESDPTPTNTKNSKRIPHPVCRSLLQDLSCQLGDDEEGLEDIILGSEESTAMEEFLLVSIMTPHFACLDAPEDLVLTVKQNPAPRWGELLQECVSGERASDCHVSSKRTQKNKQSSLKCEEEEEEGSNMYIVLQLGFF